MSRFTDEEPTVIVVDDLNVSNARLESLKICMRGEEPTDGIDVSVLPFSIPGPGEPGVTVATIPDVANGDVVLQGSYFDRSRFGYLFKVAGMQTRVEWRPNKWTVRLRTGRIPFSQDAREINQRDQAM